MYVMGSYTRDGLYIEHFTYKYQITFTPTMTLQDNFELTATRLEHSNLKIY